MKIRFNLGICAKKQVLRPFEAKSVNDLLENFLFLLNKYFC